MQQHPAEIASIKACIEIVIGEVPRRSPERYALRCEVDLWAPCFMETFVEVLLVLRLSPPRVMLGT